MVTWKLHQGQREERAGPSDQGWERAGSSECWGELGCPVWLQQKGSGKRGGRREKTGRKSFLGKAGVSVYPEVMWSQPCLRGKQGICFLSSPPSRKHLSPWNFQSWRNHHYLWWWYAWYVNKVVHGEALDNGILGPINYVIRRLGLETTDISWVFGEGKGWLSVII